MPFEKGDPKKKFEHIALEKENENEEELEIEVVDPNTPDMIQKHRPELNFPAPEGAEVVDREIFDDAWQQEIERHAQPDAFDRVDMQHESVSEHFYEHGSDTEYESDYDAEHEERVAQDAFDQADRTAELAENFNTQSIDQEIE